MVIIFLLFFFFFFFFFFLSFFIFSNLLFFTFVPEEHLDLERAGAVVAQAADAGDFLHGVHAQAIRARRAELRTVHQTHLGLGRDQYVRHGRFLA